MCNITVSLVGVVDVAMMGRLNKPTFIGGSELDMMVFNFMYLGLGFLRMGNTGLMTSQADLIAFIDAYWIWVAMLPVASFLAFRMDRIFVGATHGKATRNAMLVAAASFAATILLIPFDLMALMGSFVGYLALRGINMWWLIS